MKVAAMKVIMALLASSSSHSVVRSLRSLAMVGHRPRSVSRLAAAPRMALTTPDAPNDSRQSVSAMRSSASAAMQAPTPTVYFVMGGPGSGKGTQCARLVDHFGMVHLSAGDLLRAVRAFAASFHFFQFFTAAILTRSTLFLTLSQEVASGSTLGTEIKAVIDQGQIVKSETTVALLRNAMAGKSGPFLIDGFPRSLENLEAFEAEMGPAAFMLFLEVSEDEMETRLLKRGATSGRSDDNRETIVKRFRTFVRDSMPVVERMRKADCLRMVDAGATEVEVFGRVCGAFDDQPFAVTAEDGSEPAPEEEAPPAKKAAPLEGEPPDGFEWGGTY